MRKQSAAIASSAIMLLLCLNSSTFSQTVTPQYQTSVHNQGNIQMTISNRGRLGVDDRIFVTDPFTGEQISGTVYPRNSGFHYMTVDIAIGAVKGNDTLVSTWREFAPDAFPFGTFTMKSIDKSSRFFTEDAFSLFDLTCTYYDTLINPSFVPPDPYDKRLHRPLGIRIKQRSMAWDGANIGNFILINYEIANIGIKNLKDMFVQVSMDGRGRDQNAELLKNVESLSGFLRTWQIDPDCFFLDSVNVAYVMDESGHVVTRPLDFWEERSSRAAVGIRVLGMPDDTLLLNYNWFWPSISIGGPGNWGPRQRGIPFRSIGSGLGIPEGDLNRYYVMSHPEFDYDQLYAGTDMTALGWLPPANTATVIGSNIASGLPVESSLTFGPFDLPLRAIKHFTIAVVGGDSVHVNPTDWYDLFPYPHTRPPEPYYNSLDFSRLAENARWASWVYDNPGVDTDGDGFFGTFRMCNGDTFWIEGDGVPDFKADIPPPSPEVRVIPAEGKLTLRWNGVYSENVIDPFTRTKDFEGYRVYSGLDDRASSLSLLSSFDHLNFNMFKFIQKTDDLFVWENDDLPLTLDSLKVIFNDPNFDPLLWTRNNPLTLNDTLFRFEKQDFNQFDLTTRGGIHKVFPDAIDPGPDSLLWNETDLVFDWDPPLPKFYEYEFEVEDLLLTVRQFVSVTAFDFGFPPGNIPPRESNKLNSITESFPQNNVDSVEQYNLDVYIYPNPYRIDGNYAERGFENRDLSQAPQRARRIHFVNLPRICKITIYSLDGDRIDSFEHNFPQGGPEAMHDEWDMITRNGLIPVSGIYYWVVEAATRTQMGKLIIIK